MEIGFYLPGQQNNCPDFYVTERAIPVADIGIGNLIESRLFPNQPLNRTVEVNVIGRVVVSVVFGSAVVAVFTCAPFHESWLARPAVVIVLRHAARFFVTTNIGENIEFSLSHRRNRP